MAYGRLGSSEPPSSNNHDTVISRTRSSRLRFLLIFAATLIVACGVSVAVLVGIRNKTTGDTTSLSSSYPKPSQAMSKVCSKTRYPTLCVNSLLDFPGSTTASNIDLVHISVNMTLLHFGRALYSSAEIGNLQMDTRARAAYDDCVELLEASVDQLSSSLTSVAPPKERKPQKVESAADVLTWLSAAMTNQDTCVEGLEDVRGKVKEEMVEKLKDLSELVSNCLAIFAASNGDDFTGIPIQNRRRLLDSSDLSVAREFPKFAATNGDDFSEIPTDHRRRLLDSSDSAVAREFPNFAANGDDFSGIPIANRRLRLLDSSDSAVANEFPKFAATNGDDFSDIPMNRRRRLLDSTDSSVAREFPNSAATNRDDFSGIPIQNRRSAVAREFPKWMLRRERRLLELPVAAVQADIIVSKDGNGTCKTIGEAIKKAPEYSNRRIIIYVMAGKYEEPNLKVGRKKINLMFIGDGKGKTVISGGKSVFDNITTFHTATFAASGAGFIARDITFENWAGPAKHQAVALRVGADHAVIYRCNIIGYQDTLYVHSQRQFYRECDIYGTVDFIFGNAAVVFQNCTMYARKPMDLQKNTITAQNRKDPNQNTGISIHACRIVATSDLQASKANFSTYLGRPWKLYSRTVYMLSNMGDHVHPRGWLEWNTTFALDTLYYGEYMNYGPGGAVGQRVKWPGYRVITSPVEANRFTVSQFIFGSSWLPATGVAFLAGLAV